MQLSDFQVAIDALCNSHTGLNAPGPGQSAIAYALVVLLKHAAEEARCREHAQEIHDQ